MVGIAAATAGRGLGVLLACLVLAGCGGSAEDGGDDDADAVDPNAVYDSVSQRCGYGETGELLSLEGPDGGVLTGAVFGEGDHAAVLVHQNDEAAKMCGWISFAVQAAEQGVMTVLMDVCGFGEVIPCKDSVGDIPDQVAVAVDYARERGATSVSVVGSSMGGVIAAGTGQQAGADNIVAVSPPGMMVGLSVAAALPETTIPVLVIASPTDSIVDVDALQRAVDSSPAEPKALVVADQPGHGYVLLSTGPPDDATLTEYGELVLAWIQGDTRTGS